MSFDLMESVPVHQRIASISALEVLMRKCFEARLLASAGKQSATSL